MIKVFYRCVETDQEWWTVGKEYAADKFGIIDDDGDRCSLRDLEEMAAEGGKRPRRWCARFVRIEREVFESNGFQWFKHTPGDPMPCYPSAGVMVWLRRGVYGGSMTSVSPWKAAGSWNWSKSASYWNQIIGWRYHSEPIYSEPVGDGVTDDTAAINALQNRQPFGERTNAAMIDRDLSAIDDSSLSPAQRKHWEAMESKQAAKEKLQRDAESKALKDKAKELADAGRAMDRVGQDFNHKLGWTA